MGGLLLAAVLTFPAGVADEGPSPPAAPWGLVAVGGADGNVTLSWQVPFDDGGSPILGYRVYRAPINGSFALVGSVNSTSFVDGVAANEVNLYEYAVTANNAAGESAPSNPGMASSASGCIVIWSGVPPDVTIDWDCLGVCPLPRDPIVCLAFPSICIPSCR